MVDKARALDAIEFVQLLAHTGDFAGQPFTLLDWQHEVLWNVYGEVGADGLRRHQYAYLEIPKKNGKTELVAALAIYHLATDGPQGQIYCCAADKDQAGLAYIAAKSMIGQNEHLEKLVKVIDSKKQIVNRETKTFLRVLSAEAYTKHGLNPTVVIFDELHAQPNRDLWDVMTFGAGAARKEPLWWVITTAGDDPDRLSIGWEIHEKARKVAAGEIDDPSWYARIYGAPEDADIFDEGTWRLANPSLGRTIGIERVRQEALSAKESEAAEKLFRWLRLNQWVALKKISWLPAALFDRTLGEWGPGDLLGQTCYAGLDLSSTTDLTALVLLFPPQGGAPDWRALFECWIPDARMKERERRDHVPFSLWAKGRHVTATPGDVVDYEFVESRIWTLGQLYRVERLGVDQWGSRMLTQRLMGGGLDVLEIPQTMAGLSAAMKEMERLLRKGEMTHEQNPAARWCFGNVKIAIDGNENMKPMKNKSIDRIDIAVAWIIALATAMRSIGQASVYEDRGIRVV
jgi:phage terminase large subunit-like protein